LFGPRPYPQNLSIEFADGRLDQLEGLAADAAMGAKAATATIPIVLMFGYDPACQGRGAAAPHPNRVRCPITIY
jgi:hypothetical protein